MKWLPSVLILALFASFAHSASSLPQGTKKWNQDQNLTASAPATGADAGIDLKGVTGWRLIICAPAAQAPTGGGVKVWIRAADGLWADTPKLDALLTVSSTGDRCQSFGEYPVAVSTGWLYVTLNGLTLSGAGTQANVRLEAQIQ